MKKEIDKKARLKSAVVFLFSIFILLMIISIASAGVLEWIKETITGKATSQTVNLNISVGVPVITRVFNSSVNGTLYEGPVATSFIVNFSVNNPSGAGYLNDSTAMVNFTKSGETSRANTTCSKFQSSGTNSNYTCNVTMYWWDGAGVWTIITQILDNRSSSAINSSTTFSLGTTTGFVMGPTALTWSSISPGATNQTSSNDPILLNNTGNVAIAGSTTGNISINSTNLRGETTDTLALWASNFSVFSGTGGTPPLECGGTQMSTYAFANITSANLTKGDFRNNDGSTGQEQLYFCLRLAGTELTTQAYSTSNETSWTIKISTS